VSSAELLTVRIDTRGSAVVVAVRGELDLATVPVLRERLDEVGDRPAAPLVVDLSEVRFIASAGLALLVDLQHRCDERGVTLAVVATGSVVPRAIQVTALDQVLSVYPTVDEAVDGGERA
jgi:anti-sigma B factor antagonist